MVGKAGRSGRPRSALETRAYQVRLPIEDADRFDAKIATLAADAARTGAKVSAASVLTMLVVRWMDEDAPPAKKPAKR